MGFKYCYAALAAAVLVPAVGAQNSSLPVVDLGYDLYQATDFNSTGRYYNFSNIRYAAPPTGALRFAAPQAPAVNRSSIQTGIQGRICPQANPAWEAVAELFIPEFLAGQTQFNASSFNTSSATSGLPVQDPRTTEDCLFLDVMVPEATFSSAGSGYGAPVMVWVYGGGYTAGSKYTGDPAGLIERSQIDGGNGVIYVAMNYRLGALGWLSGPTFQENGTANAGLLDQRLAFEWVQQNIHLFGGDPNRVTVFGESAGGGSIMHHITAYGGLNGPAPFAQAIMQSPGFQPMVEASAQEGVFNNFLALLNVSTLEEARQLPLSTIQTANIIQVGLESGYGTFTYGPTADGSYVPALPGQLLARGQFDKSVNVMVGHNADEGLLFTSPYVSNDTGFAQAVQVLLPNITQSTLNYITNVLYPPIFNGSQAMGYTNQLARLSAVISEVSFTCNTFYLDKAYNNKTHAYLFAVFPSIHGQDIPYTYYNGNGSASSTVPFPQVAIELQEYITAFAMTGSPNEAGVPYFPMFGSNATTQVLNVTGISQAVDPAANQRCNWWQKGLFY